MIEDERGHLRVLTTGGLDAWLKSVPVGRQVRTEALNVLSTDGPGFVCVNEWDVRGDEGCA
jgi:hypothetical protein